MSIGRLAADMIDIFAGMIAVRQGHGDKEGRKGMNNE
jgi:hypothetical protein